jgi:hypothetical protein
VENLSTRAEADFKRVIENTRGAGTPFVLIDKGGAEYPVVGIFGDIGSLIDPVSGETIRSRSIEAVCMMKTIMEAAGKIPERGWKARATGLDGKELNLFVWRNETDRTIGVCRVTLGLKPSRETDTENGN